MRSLAINAPLGKASVNTLWVWYSSTTALKEGATVCYNFDYGTATDREGRRLNEVENPTTLNSQHFAGVAARAYAAQPTGQLIEINGPGSVCNILVAASTVLDTGILTFDVTAAALGQFRYAGMEGEGSAVPMQTTTYTGTAQLCLAKLQTGRPSGGVEVVDIVDNDAIGTLMIGGTTLVTGAAIAGGDCTYTLADGTRTGIRKKFGVITTEITTNDFVVTITTGATDDIDDVVLATVTWAGAGTTIAQEVTLEWNGSWMCVGRTDTTPAFA